MDNLRVDVLGGKYTIVQDATGSASVLREGQPWDRDIVGNNLVLSLAYDLETAREALGAIAKAVYGHGEVEPHVYKDHDAMVAMLGDARRAQPKVPQYVRDAVRPDADMVVYSLEGKYTLVHHHVSKTLVALRHGEEWQDLTGDPFLLSLGIDLDKTRTLLDEFAGATFGREAGDEPDIYAHADFATFRDRLMEAMPSLHLREAMVSTAKAGI